MNIYELESVQDLVKKYNEYTKGPMVLKNLSEKRVMMILSLLRAGKYLTDKYELCIPATKSISGVVEVIQWKPTIEEVQSCSDFTKAPINNSGKDFLYQIRGYIKLVIIKGFLLTGEEYNKRNDFNKGKQLDLAAVL